MPQGPAMDALLAHGLPYDAPLLRPLEQNAGPLFFADTARAAETTGSAAAGVASLAAAPVWNLHGSRLGMFLMYTTERHRWKARERDLFSAVTWTLAALIARLMTEDDAVRALEVAVESRDPEVKGHIERVTKLAERVGGPWDLME